VIRNPLRVKKTDTPSAPPRNQSSSEDVAHAWNSATARIEIPRSPSSAGS
jgi:hypothetical protein